MIDKWTLYIAEKYIKTGRTDRKNTTLRLSVAGIAAGVITLIAVISVMNGLQMGYIEDILEISSYHIQIENCGSGNYRSVSEIKGIKNTVPFFDIQSLVQGESSRLDPVMIRAVDPEYAGEDKAFLKQLNMVRGNFYLEDEYSIVIGFELARKMRLDTGDFISVMGLSGKSFNQLTPDLHKFKVSGIYKSGYYEYDRNLAFISLATGAGMRADPSETYTLGVKISNIYRDREIISKIKEKLGGDTETVSWRDTNRAFFSALRMEKISMMLLIGLIFVVIGVNIYNSIKRSVSEKMEDIAVIYAVGGSEKSVKQIFLMEGFIIGFTGGLAGTAAGLLIIVNLDLVFLAAGTVLQYSAEIIMYLFSVSDLLPSVEISLFPESYFYLSEVPYRILLHEVVLIFLFAVLSAVGSAYFASRKISVERPAEYLRYE